MNNGLYQTIEQANQHAIEMSINIDEYVFVTKEEGGFSVESVSADNDKIVCILYGGYSC